jgi:hypothetical protein
MQAKAITLKLQSVKVDARRPEQERKRERREKERERERERESQRENEIRDKRTPPKTCHQ